MITSTLATFAGRHQFVAAGLIILSEFCNVAIGIILGSSLLADQPGWYLAFLLAGLVFIRLLFQRYMAIRLIDLVSGERFWFQKNSYSLLFLINFLAYIIAGGISGRAVIHPEPSVSVASERSSTYSAASKIDTLPQLTPNELLNLNQTGAPIVREKPHTGTRIAYFFLFLTSIFLAIAASGLACQLACTNHGFAAVGVILLGMGVLAGGFYFLGRLFDKNMKLYKHMTKAERQREGRRFGRTGRGTVLGFVLLLVLLSVVN